METKSLFTYFVECLTQKYFCFEGRARRREYWGFALFHFLILFVAGFIFGFLVGVTQNSMYALGTNVVSLAFLLPSLGAAVRRMHDVGRSGWWVLVPFVNLYFACCDSQPGDNEYGANPKGL